MRRHLLPLFAALVCGCAASPEELLGSQQQALLTEVESFGSNPGSLRMFTYVPAGMPSTPAPLVVALHGCYQGASDYEAAGWNALADRYKFYVVYPQMDGNYGCLHWFDPSENARGQGEALSIKQMVDHMKASHAVDGTRVFATGLSSGGAMTAALLAAYPDVFAAGAPLAGIPVGCASSLLEASSCMYGGQSQTAQEWGDLVREAYPGYSGAWPRISIWQGTADTVVDFANFGELVSQWTNVHGVDSTADATETVGQALHREFRDGQGRAQVESWELTGMDHGTPVDPSNGCGTARAYVLDVGLCSSERIARFFGIVGSSADAGAVPGPDAGAAGLDASEEAAGPDAATPGADAGRKADAGAAVEDPGQCNCGVASSGPESFFVLVALAGLLHLRLRRLT